MRAAVHRQPERPVVGAGEDAEDLDLLLGRRDPGEERVLDDLLEAGAVLRAVANRAGVIDVEEELREVQLPLRLVARAHVRPFERGFEQIADGAGPARLRKGAKMPRERVGHRAASRSLR